jgi:glycosyltransferase involved in cell wall biosynthesis
MTIRICFVIPTLDRGGAEKQLSMLVRGLDREAFEPIVLLLTRTGPLEQEILDAGIRVEHVDKRGKFDPFAWWRLRNMLRSLKPDIVHTWLFAANAYGRSAARSAGVPCILGSERSVDPWKGSWQLAIDRWLTQRTDGLTANSPGIVDFYADKGIPRERFQVIPNGIQPSSVAKISRDEACQRMGVDPSKRILMSIGRLWHQKGYKEMIWSAEMLRVLRGDASYVIIGDGPERARLEEYRDNVRAASQVYMIGHREDAAQLLPHADVLWNGSLYEGQSNVILEAMLSRVLVIASDIPGNRDLVQNDRTGILYPAGDVDRLMRVTNQILSDEAMRSRLIEAAYDHVRLEHDVRLMIQRHESYYRRMQKS